MAKWRYRQDGKIRNLIIFVLLGCAGIISVGVWGFLSAGRNIFDLLAENKELKQAITNLTRENQIGYAKVLSQQIKQGKLYTKLLFVETDRANPTIRVLEKEYEIEGDVVHFDTLIVTFGEQLVRDGKERSMYLWRRIYGETMQPQDGFPIETVGAQPQRYADICAKLSLKDRNMFWEEIWKLSNDPHRLQAAGIKAIYGNVVYRKLKPGLIYVFKISNSGVLYPEVVPDL